MGGTAGGELHAVLVPFPAQGHINPFLHLARLLVRVHGFRVTFINVAQNLHDRCIRYSSSATTRWDSGIKFVLLPDAPGEFSMSTGAQMQKFMSALTNLGPNFEAQLQELQAESSITFMIRDWVMPSAHKAARKLGIPVAALATMSAAATHCSFHQEAFQSLCSLIPGPAAAACDNEATSTAESSEEDVSWMDRIKTFPPPPKDSAEAAMLKRTVGDVLPGLAPDLTVADLPSHFWIRRPRPRSAAQSTKYSEQNELLRDCDCLLVNTFDELEGDAIRGMDQNSLILPVGPLVLNPRADDSHLPSHAENGNGPARLQQEPDLGDAITCSLREEDPTTMQWLDEQSPASVIYVSFGSLASVAGEQLVEIARGLEASQQPFLWVIREDLVSGEDPESESFSTFMRSFREATKERSHIAPWVAQTAVLAHRAVGAFLSHCGWNSTLESVAAGVPMVAMPVFADQLVNGFYATQVWGNGVRLEREVAGLQVTRDEVARKVRTVLAGAGAGAGDGAAVRARAAELRKAARAAVMPGGSSHSAMANFVHHMINARIP